MKAKRAQNCAVCGYRMEAGTNIGWLNGAPYHLKACTPANVGADAVKRIDDDRRDVTVQGNLYGPKTGPTI
jgi:hypothetical protein